MTHLPDEPPLGVVDCGRTPEVITDRKEGRVVIDLRDRSCALRFVIPGDRRLARPQFVEDSIVVPYPTRFHAVYRLPDAAAEGIIGELDDKAIRPADLGQHVCPVPF